MKTRLHSNSLSTSRRKGEPFVWVSGGSLALGVIMIVGLLALVVGKGTSTFWPGDIERFTLGSGQVVLGTVHDSRTMDTRALPPHEDFRPWWSEEIPSPEPEELLIRVGNMAPGLNEKSEFLWLKHNIPEYDVLPGGERSTRRFRDDLYKLRDPAGYATMVVKRESPEGATLVERLEGGVLTGFVVEVRQGETVVATRDADGAPAVWKAFNERLHVAQAVYEERYELEKEDLGAINAQLSKAEHRIKKIAYEMRDDALVTAAIHHYGALYDAWNATAPSIAITESDAQAGAILQGWRVDLNTRLENEKAHTPPQATPAQQEAITLIAHTMRERGDILAFQYIPTMRRVEVLRERELHEASYTVEAIDGRRTTQPLSHVVRAVQPNELGWGGRMQVYLSRTWEFVTAEPREANTEGGIFQVIVGTLFMTVIMSLAVVPLGVITALYLREYAKQGPVVAAVRIAVNNLAGVPSIVFGIFGLGFFCLIVGGSIDSLFYPELLPSPTFGGGGLMWASLTLALLTIPVVVVATEEALSSVPSAQREASLGCGASKFQTIWNVVLPQALPGILTGAILAMARGAGEVAPLMLVGVVKDAPLPIDGNAPYVHLDGRFTHLGFHIYDLGFQSASIDNSKPLVFTTALVLLVLVGVLNVFAIRARNNLRKRLKSSHI